MSFAERLRTERQKINVSTEAFAKACGVSRSYITLIETGRRLPGRKILANIAKALHVKPYIVVNWYLEDLREKLQ